MKKLMVVLTGVATVATLGAAIPTTALTANAATRQTTVAKKTAPSLTVATINNQTKQITGTATKGAKIMVKSTQNAKQNLGTATASKTTGKYTVKLAKTLKTSQTVYVYATNLTTKAYFYRIIHVQAAKATNTKTVKKAAATKSKSSSTTKTTTTTKKAATTKKTTATKKTTTSTKTSSKAFTVKMPAGTWKSNTANQYSQTLTFSQKAGFSQTLYKNGKQAKKVVTGSNYNLTAETPTLWKVNYKSGSKTQTLYLHYTAANKFTLVNAKNVITKTKVGNAPAAIWTFTN